MTSKEVILKPNHRKPINPYATGMELQTLLETIREAMDLVTAEERYATRNDKVILVDIADHDERFVITEIKVVDNHLQLQIRPEF